MKTLREIRIDRTKTLAEDPGTGHNRWHPDIPPVIRCDLGDEQDVARVSQGVEQRYVAAASKSVEAMR